MKYTINKFQTGGVMAATYTPIEKGIMSAPVMGSSGQDSKSKDDSDSILDKDIYKKMVEEGGLINDVNAFMANILKLESSSLYPYLNKNNTSSVLRHIGEFNVIKQNKQMWDDVYKKATESGTLGEVAVDAAGRLFVRDNGKIKNITTEQYKSGKGKYHAMTVGDALRARQSDPNLAYNTDIFSIGESAINTNSILKKIDETMKLIKEDHIKTERHYSKESLQKQLSQLQISKAPTQEQKAAIAELTEMLETPGDQYKVISDNTSKGRYRNLAMNYIASSLTQPEKVKLNAVAAINGTTLNELVLQSLNIGLSGETKISEISPEKVGAGEGTDGTKGMTNESNEELFFSGKLNIGEKFAWNDPKAGKTMLLPTTGHMPWMHEGKPTGLITLNQASKTNVAQYVNTDGVTFGGKALSLVDKDQVIQEDNFSRVMMPTNNDGTPNYTLLGKFQDAQTEAEKHPEWTAEDLNKFYIDRGLGYIRVDASKNIEMNANMRPFMVGYGYTTDKAAVTSGNEHIQKVPEKAEKEIEKSLLAVYKAAKVDAPTSMFGTDYYKGIIAYPIRETAAIIAAANKGNVYAPKVDIGTIRQNLNVQSQEGSIPQGTASLLNKQ